MEVQKVIRRKDATPEENHFTWDVTNILEEMGDYYRSFVNETMQEHHFVRLGSGMTRTGYASPCGEFVLKIPFDADGAFGKFGKHTNLAEFRNTMYADSRGIGKNVARTFAAIQANNGWIALQTYIDHIGQIDYDAEDRWKRWIKEKFEDLFIRPEGLGADWNFDLHPGNLLFASEDRPVAIDLGWNVGFRGDFDLESQIKKGW